jgi:hypothetical protein
MLNDLALGASCKLRGRIEFIRDFKSPLFCSSKSNTD